MSFIELFELNVNNRVEKRKGDSGSKELSYLSWSWAWAEFVKFYPNATYEVSKNPANGMPYLSDESGACCFVKVCNGEGLTHEMWLPVMNGANKAMKNHQYTYTTKYGEKSVEAYTMFDINKTVMRCLAKCLAMFGLGLYIYNGEDLPEVSEETKKGIMNDFMETSERVRALLGQFGEEVQYIRDDLTKAGTMRTLTVEMLRNAEKTLLNMKAGEI